jgi:hypothetical protein
MTGDQLGALKLDYNAMLAILQADAKGGMTATEFDALKALVAKFNVANGITVSNYVAQISDDVVLGNVANANWTGGAKYAVALGDLTATSTETQANELIGKWFLGTDLPSSKITMNGAPNFSVTYAAVNEPLFGPNGPQVTDINQGYLGDCFVLAPLAEMADQDPSALTRMITANGNNTYSVAFTVNGTIEYITVDNELPGGGTLFNQAANDWGGLVEKAYAQLQAGGNLTGGSMNMGNNWSSIANGGAVENTLEEFTGAAVITDFVAKGDSFTSYAYDGAGIAVPNGPSSHKVLASVANLDVASVQSTLAAALAAGDEVILSSNTDATDAAGKTTLISNHAYAVTGFDTATSMFELYNPWGTEKGQTWDTRFEVGLGTLLAAGDTLTVASPVQLVKPLATPT